MEKAHNRVGEKLAGRGPAGALWSRLMGSKVEGRGWQCDEGGFHGVGSLAQTQSGQGAERIRTATSFRNR